METSRAAQAEARRQKLLARGRDRLKQITGGVQATELPELPTDSSAQVQAPDLPDRRGSEVAAGVAQSSKFAGEALQTSVQDARESSGGTEPSKRQKEWSTYEAAPAREEPTPPLSTPQRLRLAASTTIQIRVLLALACAMLSCLYFDRPRPESQQLPQLLHALVNNGPPVVLVAVLSATAISTAFIRLSLNPAAASRQARRAVSSQEGLLQKTLPSAVPHLDVLRAALDFVASLVEAISVFFVAVVVFSGMSKGDLAEESKPAYLPQPMPD